MYHIIKITHVHQNEDVSIEKVTRSFINKIKVPMSENIFFYS